MDKILFIMFFVNMFLPKKRGGWGGVGWGGRGAIMLVICDLFW